MSKETQLVVPGDSEDGFSRDAARTALELVGLTEQLRDCESQLETLATLLNGAKKDAVVSIKERLGMVVTSLESDEHNSELIRLHQEGSAPNRVRSEIEALGIEGEVIRLAFTLGRPAKDIAELFNLKTREVSQFLKYYQKAAPAKRAQLARRSVFDSRSQLEDLATVILRQLHNLEGVDNITHVQYVKEMRMVIDQATKITERMLNYAVYENMVKSVASILEDELPHKKIQIYKMLENVLPANQG